MNRREFFKASAVVVATALLPTVTLAAKPKRSIFCIDDGGEQYWWAAESEEEARRVHHEEFGQHADDPAKAIDVEEWADDEELKIDTQSEEGVVTKTCAEWARDSWGDVVPMIGCSCY